MPVQISRPVPPFLQYCATLIPTVFDNSLSYYEALCALTKWLQDNLVNVVNNNAKITEEYIKIVDELQKYVENYFENLDVQDEVDNKLDAMVEAGTLQEIVASYLEANVTWTFDTVADMKLATNLTANSYAQTLGFHTIGDGGGGIYKITDTGTANEMNIIAVDNLLAVLVPTEANPLQFGAYGDGTHNDTDALQACADYARTNGLVFHAPPKDYLSDSVTLTEVKHINFEGVFIPTADTEAFNIFESTQTYACDIYVNRVNGKIVMKGLNTSDIRIQRAYSLDLVADSTDNHHWLCYSKFYLGFVNKLYIYDDGTSGVGQFLYINENIFIGGRFDTISIGGNGSSYHHENNLFLKPLCEDTTITLDHARANIFEDARLENNCTITFGAESVANVINQEWKGTDTGYFFNKEHKNPNITIVDNSNGQNAFGTNKGMHQHEVANVNVYNNPKQVATSGDKLNPAQGAIIYRSDFIPLPDIDCAISSASDVTTYQFRVYCYDSSKNLITTNPNLGGDMMWAGMTWDSGIHAYRNGAYSYPEYVMFLKSATNNVKYIKFELFAIESGTTYLFNNIKITLNSYGNMKGNYIDACKQVD